MMCFFDIKNIALPTHAVKAEDNGISLLIDATDVFGFPF